MVMVNIYFWDGIGYKHDMLVSRVQSCHKNLLRPLWIPSCKPFRVNLKKLLSRFFQGTALLDGRIGRTGDVGCHLFILNALSVTYLSPIRRLSIVYGLLLCAYPSLTCRSEVRWPRPSPAPGREQQLDLARQWIIRPRLAS